MKSFLPSPSYGFIDLFFSFGTFIRSWLFLFSMHNSSMNHPCCCWSIVANPIMELARDSLTNSCLSLFSIFMEASIPSTCEGGGRFFCEAAKALFRILVLTITNWEIFLKLGSIQDVWWIKSKFWWLIPIDSTNDVIWTQGD